MPTQDAWRFIVFRPLYDTRKINARRDLAEYEARLMTMPTRMTDNTLIKNMGSNMYSFFFYNGTYYSLYMRAKFCGQHLLSTQSARHWICIQ